MKLKVKEKDVLKACIEYLKLKKYVYIRNNSGATIIDKRFIRYGQKGSADIIICGKNGEFIAAECKSSIGKLSSSQSEFGDNVLKSGGRFIIVRDLRDLIDAGI